MDPQQYLAALRKRWIVILLLTLAGLVAGFGYGASQQPGYEATSGVLLSASTATTTQEQLQGATFAQDVVPSYVSLATQPIVLQPVIDQLGLDTNAADLAKHVTAAVATNTVIINITASDPSPVRAAAIANAVADSLTTVAKQLSSDGKDTSIVMHRTAVATTPVAPSSPNKPFLLVTGGGLGLLIGLAYALGRQALGTKVASEQELRSTPGLEDVPFLGAISHRKRRDGAVNVLMSEPHGVMAEEYRRLVTNIEFAGVDEQVRSVTVTSALPGDGKSTTAINLAASAAEREQRVLLIDGDLRLPSVASYLGIDGSVGLSNVLLGSARPTEAIQRVGSMDVLPAGVVPPNVTQLVNSEAMRRLFEELAARYDFIVVDAPPLLPVVDALTFSRITAGGVLVARQRVTRRKQFAMAIESMLQVDAKVVGVALNDVSRSESSYRQGYGYGAQDLEVVRAAVGSRRDAAAPFFPDAEDDRASSKPKTRPTYADR